MIGKSLYAAFPAVRGTGFGDFLKKVWFTGKPENFSLVKREKDTILLWKESYIYKLSSGEVVSIFVDMTNEKNIQERLIISENAFRNLAENSKDIIYRLVFQPEPHLDFISPSVEAITGYSQREFYMVPKLYHEILHPADAHLVLEENGNYVFREQMELRVMRKDGTIGWLEVKRSAIRSESGVINTVTGVMRDITERKRLEISLDNTKKELEELINNLPGLAVKFDPLARKIDFASRQCESLTGFTAEEIMQSDFHWLERISREDKVRFEETVLDSIANLKPYKQEYRFTTKDGTERVFLEHGSVFLDKGGRKVLECFTADVTNHWIIERRLVESLKTYDSIFNNDHSPMLIFKPDSYRIVDVNPAALSFYGYPRDKFLDMDIRDISVSLAHGSKPWLGIAQNGNTGFVATHRLADGSVRQVQVYRGPIYREGEELAFAIVHDITRQTEAEKSLNQTLENVQRLLYGTINMTSRMVELRDPYTAGHQKRVSTLTTEIGKLLDLPSAKIEEIRIAALLHDIGKTSIPSELLSKPGQLNRIERLILEEHPRIAYELLNKMDFSESIATSILQHHERIDGSGYPNHLKDEDIILEAKIIAVADVVEAMASHRPYRPALGIDKALDEIASNSGVKYDPKVVTACLKVFKNGFNF